jgi:tetratricopeptide (TPR) repeat protein/predicted Ser/Thr protein kinase
MQNRNPRFDPQDRANSTNQPGVSVPAKGDSSGSNPPADSDATLVEFPKVSLDPAATQVDVSPVPGAPPTPRVPARTPARPQVGISALQVGDVLGGRYEILQLLGEGGMGAVYKAMDRELDRPVALKLIRPELAANPSILARFKQELLLAHQVTHRNVIRIYDLGDADGVKFISMEFVEGQDLRSLILEKKKFSPEDAVEITQQICRALEATHSVGVIHRDLKPQNIMRDQTGRILLMDFGLARTVAGEGMTQTGALVGTMEYMSPEQALAKDLDQRSDLFTLGLILYELLTGVTPFKAESVVASLIRRTQERAKPVSDQDGTIPRFLSNVVSKCLERDSALRYQTATQLLRDLEAWQSNRAAATLGFQPAVEPWGRTIHWPLVTGIATVLLLLVIGYAFRGTLFSPATKAASAPALSLAVVPFHNTSGDQSWDWLGPSLADMLSTDVGQSAHLRAVSSDRVQRIFQDLKIAPNAIVDSSTLSRIAELTNADTLVSGQYTKLGDQIRIDATLQDRKHNRTILVKAEAANQNDLSAAVDRLAGTIRQNLALSSDVVKELQAQSFKPTSRSVDALRDYNQGLQLLRQGNNLEAQKLLEAATKEDPQFAIAYSRLSEAYSALGYDAEAEQSSRRAVDLSDQLPITEKYLIQASNARILKEDKKAIAAYEDLAKNSPDNLDVQFALGGLYEDNGDLDTALAHYGSVLKSDPKNLDALLATGRVDCKRGDPQAGLDPLSAALNIAVQVDNKEEQATILQITGIAYKLMGRSEEALRNYQQSTEINTGLGKKRGVAANLSEISQVQSRMGKPDLALSSLKQALSLLREIGAKKEAGDTLIDLGQRYEDQDQHDLALENFKEALQVERDAGDERYQALCLNNIGNADFAKGEYADALTYFQQALDLRQKLNNPAEIAETLSNIGEAMAKTGQYDKSVEDHLQALDLERKAGDKRGAALDSTSLGVLFGYQGRLGAAVKSTAEAVQSFRDLQDRSLWMAQALTDYANALVQAGQISQASAILKEAGDLARELKSLSTQAQVMNVEGDRASFQGDFKTAKSSYQHALETAQRAKSREDVIRAQFNLAKIQLQEGDAGRALAAFHDVAQQANATGLKYLSLESSVFASRILLRQKKYSEVEREARRALAQSEPQSLRLLIAAEHDLLGNALTADANPSEAVGHFRNALRTLDEIKNDPGAEKAFDRSDLKALYAEVSQSAGVKN